MKKEIAIGDKFNRLEVLSFAGVDSKSRCRLWNVKCKCGITLVVPATRLRSNKTKSCGCLQREVVGNSRRKHNAASGYKQTPEYYVWQAMLRRCLTKTHKHYADYGDRGITVCDRWLSDNNGFVNFLADMGERPSKKHTLERNDNEAGYSPNNCVWATWRKQGSNKRNSRKLTYKGRTEIISEWSRITGIPHRTLFNRLDAGKAPEEVLFPYSESN